MTTETDIHDAPASAIADAPTEAPARRELDPHTIRIKELAEDFYKHLEGWQHAYDTASKKRRRRNDHHVYMLTLRDHTRKLVRLVHQLTVEGVMFDAVGVPTNIIMENGKFKGFK